ncbi:carboxylesterase [Exophiala viscosa]|uniref:carboxylesterase n=1 Tax=Exophiala viscosa TaxID=2486360 RepID=UPI00219AC7A3|nr:carboxylesterase [Exophiala viscosa]
MQSRINPRSVLFPLVVVSEFCNAALYNTVVETNHGPIQGYPAFNSTPSGNLTNWEHITVWKGIPFAASTAAQNRFRSPQPAESWNQTLLAKDFGPICPSATTGDNGYNISEDCLNLNIWSAANSSDAKLPVVMWSYPAESTAADALFDGGGMADKGIVYVNYNYRTGSFGWLAHPWLSDEVLEETGHNSSGKWGMLDQFAALKWIHANIAAFGGDPDHITVMGQSAGSAATYHIVNSPLTKGLIVGAIIESGVRDPHDPLATSLAEGYQTLETALETGEEYVASLNVSSLEELRALPMDNLTTSFMDTPTYLESLQKGPANDIPIITGNTKDESGANYGQVEKVTEYYSFLNETYDSDTGNWTSEFLALYPTDNSTSATGAYDSQFTDRSKVGTWLWANLWHPAASSPVYTYFWDHAPPNQTRGAYHESEINYVLNNLYDTDSPWTAEDYEIAAKMNGYWADFIKTGDPNGNNLPS